MAAARYSSLEHSEKDHPQARSIYQSFTHLLRRGGKWWAIVLALVIAGLLWRSPHVQIHAPHFSPHDAFSSSSIPSYDTLRAREKHLVIAAKQDTPLGWTRAIPDEYLPFARHPRRLHI